MADTGILKRPDGNTIAYDRLDGAAPTVVFLHGLKSDRKGAKAEVLLSHARARGLGFVRLDMFGHGQSSGDFEEGTISRWVDDTLAVVDQLTRGPLILVGSSMGGFVMVKAALARPHRIAGLIGIAAGPDFTEDLIWANMTPEHRAIMDRDGAIDMPSEYAAQPYRISRVLIEDGRRNLVLRGPIDISVPVRLLHGKADTSVPWQVSHRLAEKITGPDVRTIYIPDGDHRLSRPQDLKLLTDTLDGLVS